VAVAWTGSSLSLTGGFSVDLTHHVRHAIGGLMWGFSSALFDDPQTQPSDPEAQAALLTQMAAKYPNLVQIAMATAHDEESVVGHGCDDQFEFALDLVLDGFERLHRLAWTSTDQRHCSDHRRTLGA
jgi:hypothetical protein